MPRDTEDEIAEANYEARRARRRQSCHCEDLPLYCPGPENCPYSGLEPDDDETDDDEEAEADAD